MSGTTPTIEEKTIYCVPIDEIDPSIEETATLEIPLEGKYSPNKATNSLIRTVLNYVSFLAIIVAGVIVLPLLYQPLIVDLVVKSKSLIQSNQLWYDTVYRDETNEKIAQRKLNAIKASDTWLLIFLLISSIITMQTGIIHNYVPSTILGVFIFLFAIIMYGVIWRVQSDVDFIKNNTGVAEGELDHGIHESPSFDQIDPLFSLLEVIKNTFIYLKEGTQPFERFGYFALIGVLLISMIMVFVFAFEVKYESIAAYSFIFLPLCIYISVFLKFIIHS